MNGAHPEGEWSALLDRARVLIDAHDLMGARTVLREALKYSDKTWGEDDVHLIKPLHLMAESFFREHHPLDPNNGSEIQCLRRALGVARGRLPADHLEIARLGGFLGSHLVLAGHIDEGCALMLECIEIAHKNASEDFTRYFTGIAQARVEQGRHAEAIPFFERAVVVYERRDPSSTIHANARFQLGKCLSALGRRQEALNNLELALRLVDADRVDGKRRHAPLMSDIMEVIDRVKTETP